MKTFDAKAYAANRANQDRRINESVARFYAGHYGSAKTERGYLAVYMAELGGHREEVTSIIMEMIG